MFLLILSLIGLFLVLAGLATDSDGMRFGGFVISVIVIVSYLVLFVAGVPA